MIHDIIKQNKTVLAAAMFCLISRVMGIRFGPKVGQIGTNWDKSGTFSDQISEHFGAFQNILAQSAEML